MDLDPGASLATVTSDLSAASSDIHVGIQQTGGIQPSRSLWAWGSDSDGQLGDGGVSDFSTKQSSPIQVGSAQNWKKVAAGEFTSFGLRTDGTLWAWGGDQFGRLGDGGSIMNQPSPVQIGSATNWVDISAGTFHTLGLRADGTLWDWGIQKGEGEYDFFAQSSPLQVGNGTNWVAISASPSHSMALQGDGTLWTWGGIVMANWVTGE